VRIDPLFPLEELAEDVTAGFTHVDLWKWLNGDLTDLATDEALGLLLMGMKLFYEIDPSNVRGFTGRYIFRTRDGTIAATADFVNGRMHVHDQAQPPAQATVIFSDGQTFRSFLLNEDILQGLLQNDITVEGNMNYVFRFGFLVQDLQHRLPLLGDVADLEGSGG
jgi:hypothetical protein